MGNTPSRDGGTPDPSGGTDCAHPSIGATDTAEVATPLDQYTTRHNPFVWFQSVIGNTKECDANDVPLGTLGANGQPSSSGHLAHDLRSESTTPRFGFITPNLCDDGHDETCAGPNSTGSHVGGLTGADEFLKSWIPLILGSPAYRHGDMLVVITFDESDVGGPGAAAACCNEPSGPNTHAPGDAGATTDSAAPGGGQIGALLLNSKYIVKGSTDTAGSYNHYSALRSYEDLLGLTTGGADGKGHLGFAAASGLAPFGADVFPARLSRAEAARARPTEGESVHPAQRGPVSLRIAHVLGGRKPDHGHVRPALEDLRRHPQRQRAGRHDHVVGHDRVRTDRRPATDHGPMQYDASRAGQRLVLEVQPSRWARWPTTQPSPMTVGKPGPACMTVPSWMEEPAPTVMVP